MPRWACDVPRCSDLSNHASGAPSSSVRRVAASAPRRRTPGPAQGWSRAGAVVLQTRRTEASNDRRSSHREELLGNAEDRVNELSLPDRIALRDPADLTFSDRVHRLIAFDCSTLTLGG